MAAPDSNDSLQAIAARHGFSEAAAGEVLRSLQATGGRQAQFSHPDLGGMGQWMPGMMMIGDMFNTALKARVDALCRDLAALATSGGAPAGATPPSRPTPAPFSAMRPPSAWWPVELGEQPNASGAQNGVRYAFFAATSRLALEQGGAVAVYDTGGRQIVSVSQQQNSSNPGSLVFKDTKGQALDLASLRRVA